MNIARLDTTDYASFLPLLEQKQPVLLGSALVADWPVFRHWFTATGILNYDAFANRYRDLNVTALDCSSGDTTQTTLGAVFGLWRADEAQQTYIKDLHLPLRISQRGGSIAEELYTVPNIVADDWMNDYYCSHTSDDFRFIYAGGGGTFTPVHRDVYGSYSVSTNIHGSKRWTMFPPNCATELQALLKQAEYTESHVDVRTWSSEILAEFRALGMLEIDQEARETIFVPSGWYHQVTNLTHPTISLNHNWCNSYNIRSMYSSLAEEYILVRASISDVHDALCKRNQEGWQTEWEECVSDLMRKSSGWDWAIFWSMVLHALEPTGDATPSQWQRATEQCRPSRAFVLAQLRPCVDDFAGKHVAELLHLPRLALTFERVRAKVVE